jgi:putative tryptophan/tyrosine transport system substrate-binding protein
MRRRDFIALAGGAAIAAPLAARAQQPPIPVVGFLHSETPDAVRAYVVAFHRALSEAGFTEGQNVAIEYRWAGGHYDKLPGLVADLVNRSVTVIVAGGGSAYAVKASGTSIPTIFTAGADPVQAGLVPSLSRPGGTMTGVAFFVVALGPKQLEMLLAAVPSAKQIGFVSNPGYANAQALIDELEIAVRTVGRKLNIQRVANEAEIEPVFAAFSQQGVDALIVGGDPSVFRWRDQVVAQAARHALPACYGWREFATAGGLMSYGADVLDAYHQIGVYTARVLKGTKPADLPVVQPEKIELVLNLKTAKTLGLTFPLSLLGRADEVIE